MIIKKMVNPFRFAAAMAVFLFCLFYAIYFFADLRIPEFPLCGLICILFGYLAYKNGATVSVSEKGIALSFLRYQKKFITWQELHEIGILGEKIFHRKKQKRTGTKYIYFSCEKMNEEDRFRLALQWPPKDMIYLVYSPDVLTCIQNIWDKEIILYNTGGFTI